jgi:hypothetical protein
MLQSTTEFLRNSENQTSFNRNECSIAYHSTAAHLKSIWGPKDIPKLSHYLMGRYLNCWLQRWSEWATMCQLQIPLPWPWLRIEDSIHPPVYSVPRGRSKEKNSTRLMPLKLPLLMVFSLCFLKLRKQFYLSSIHPGSKMLALQLPSRLHSPTSSGSMDVLQQFLSIGWLWGELSMIHVHMTCATRYFD